MKRPGIGMGVFIFNNKKFLMILRHGAHGRGTWSVPGGWMEFGESFEDTAKREVAEEVGLKIKNVRFGAVTNTVFTNEDIHSVTVWLLSDCVSGEPKILEPKKIKKLAWSDFDSLPKPLFEPWTELLSSEFIGNIKKQLQ
ncbi:MAG TPA: NUDIX domain-containing protein [Candidatus Saccharimonadales bacterium]